MGVFPLLLYPQKIILHVSCKRNSPPSAFPFLYFWCVCQFLSLIFWNGLIQTSHPTFVVWIYPKPYPSCVCVCLCLHTPPHIHSSLILWGDRVEAFLSLCFFWKKATTPSPKPSSPLLHHKMVKPSHRHHHVQHTCPSLALFWLRTRKQDKRDCKIPKIMIPKIAYHTCMHII